MSTGPSTGRTRAPGLDITVDDAPVPLGDGTRRAARLAVCAHARDAAEARDLLAVLDLLPTSDDTAPPPMALIPVGVSDRRTARLRGRVLA